MVATDIPGNKIVRALRRPVRQTALAIDPSTSRYSRCRILDRSSTGMRLIFAESRTPLPTFFWLIDVGGGLSYDGDVIWRRGREIGAAITNERSLTGCSLKALWHKAVQRIALLPPIL